MKRIPLLTAIFLAILTAASPSVEAQAQGRSMRIVTLYDLSKITTPTYCALGPADISGTARIAAAASNTITAVSGTPFAAVSVGDELSIGQATAVPPFYLVGVEAKASSTSITGAYRNPTTHATSAMTFSSATFSYRKLGCGTGNEDGIIPVNYGPWNIQITTERIAATSIQWHIQCRSASGAPWVQVSPALDIPASTATYDTISAVSSYSVSTASSWAECRVGMFVDTDTGVQAVSVTASMRSN